jgi:hypothetical protein
MSRETEIADLLRKAGRAESLPEQREFVRQATELQNEGIESKRAANEWNAEDARIRDTLVPGRVHELHTAATDWITELDTSFDAKEASQAMIVEASLWYATKSDDVKSYEDEYTEQARGMARHLAGKYGDEADVAERAFLDEASRLRTTAVRAGLVTEAADGSAEPEESATPDDDPNSLSAQASSPYGTDLWSNIGDSYRTAASGLPEVGQQGNGVPTDTFSSLDATNGNLPPEATSSNRAPALQELEGPTSQDVVPANDPGLNNQAGFPVSGSTKESNMSSAQCPTCGGHGRVAVRRAQAALPSIGDIAKFAASGLDQIDQIADAKDNPSAPGIPYPEEVAFPWALNPAQQVPAAINQAEQQIADRQKLSPTARRTTATGRDNSGWIGDAGARGTDYPGEQAPTGDASSSDGYVDPVYGQGGDQGNAPVLPYGHQEADDTTNAPNQWAPGQPTQADNGWREAVAHNPQLASAIAFVNQHLAAYNRSGR